jgi:hypothetical protein
MSSMEKSSQLLCHITYENEANPQGCPSFTASVAQMESLIYVSTTLTSLSELEEKVFMLLKNTYPGHTNLTNVSFLFLIG